jgi:hypothetical protein
MSSDHDLCWRLTVKFESKPHAHGIFSALKTHASAALATSRLKDGVIAQHDGQWLRIYADSYDALRRAQATVANVIDLEGVQAKEQAERRGGEEDGWESVDLPPVPERDASLVSQHYGKGPWGAEAEPNRVQAHIELGSKHTAQAFAKELSADGYDIHQAGSFLFIFAENAAAVRKLGNALKERAPPGAQLFFEGEARTIFI